MYVDDYLTKFILHAFGKKKTTDQWNVELVTIYYEGSVKIYKFTSPFGKLIIKQVGDEFEIEGSDEYVKKAQELYAD